MCLRALAIVVRGRERSGSADWNTGASCPSEGLVLDVADQPALVGVGHLGRALDRGHAADHGLRLHVLEQRLARQRAERVRRVVDQRPRSWSSRATASAAGVRLGPPRRRPQREAVVGDVVVEVDQARVDDPAGLDAVGVLEPGRRGVPAVAGRRRSARRRRRRRRRRPRPGAPGRTSPPCPSPRGSLRQSNQLERTCKTTFLDAAVLRSRATSTRPSPRSRRTSPAPTSIRPRTSGVEWGPIFHRGRLDGSARGARPRPGPRRARVLGAADPRRRGGPAGPGLPAQARDRAQLRDGQHLPVQRLRAGRRREARHRPGHRRLPPPLARRAPP